MHTDRWRVLSVIYGLHAALRVCRAMTAILMITGVAQRCRTHNRRQTSQRSSQSNQQEGSLVPLAGGHQIRAAAEPFQLQGQDLLLRRLPGVERTCQP